MRRDSPTPRADAVEAVRSLRERALTGRPEERISIEAPFEGRILAEEIVADADVPGRDRATMDGFALDATAGYPYEVVDGQVFPEDDPPSIGPGEAVRVATGAAIPPEADAVLKVEEATVADGSLRGPAIESGTYVYGRGSNVAAGETLFEAGERLSARDAIVLRDLGRERVSVAAPFDVGLIATGTEIQEGRSADLDSPMLASLVRSWGHEATIAGTVPDDYDRVEDAVADAAAEFDVVVTTGGTSVGAKDHAVSALRSLGEVRFHGVAIRPGKPLAAAALPDRGAVAFAVPGKPVGAHTVATLVLRPFFAGTDALPTVSATATAGVDVPAAEFEYAIPVAISGGEATPLGHESSPLPVYGDVFDPSVLSSSTRAARADGFVLTETGFAAQETVSVVPYASPE